MCIGLVWKGSIIDSLNELIDDYKGINVITLLTMWYEIIPSMAVHDNAEIIMFHFHERYPVAITNDYKG